MNRIFNLVLLMAVLASSAYAQNCTPLTNPSAGPDCASAPFLCCGEVNGLSGTTSATPNPTGPTPLCPGNANSQPNNTEWVSFAAGSTSITLNLDLSNCSQTGNGAGAQVGIYSDCNFASSPYCNGNQNNGSLVIPLNGLVIGEVYHLFIDGWNGSVCDYTFTVTSGSTFAPEPQSPSTITNSNNITSLCAGAGAQTFNAPLGLNSSFNLWDVSPALPFIDNGTSITITDWSAAEGQTVQICATGLNDCYTDPTGYIPTCYSVMVNSDLQMNAVGSYCQEDGGYDFPQDNLPTLYQFGTHIINVPNPSAGQGCEIEYTLDVTALQAETLDSNIVLCPGVPWVNQATGQAYFPNPGGPLFLTLPFGQGVNGCQRNINLQLAQIDTSAQIIASPSTVLNCDNPNIILTAGVNFDPQVTYTYEWETQDGNIIGGTTGQTAIANQEGTYTLTVTMETSDDRGLVICTSVPININLTEDVVGPDVTNISQSPASCGTVANGTATVNPSGGVTPYTYIWDAAANNQMTQTATGLAPGTYSVTVLDNTQCESVTTVQVLGTPVVALDPNPTIVNVPCFDESTGSATVAATGGTGTITYTWDANAGGQSGPTATGLAAGTYMVTAVDDLGCEDITSVTITQPTDAIGGMVGTITASACGLATGTIDITPSGGSTPYSFAWSDGTTITEDLAASAAGAYQVTITDNNLCSIVLSGSIPNADGPSIDAIVTSDAGCLGADDGSLLLQYSGGMGPYNIQWDVPAGQTPIPDDTENPTGLIAGSYNVTITDANMCVVSGTETVGEPALLTATATATDSDCNATTGNITLTVMGGSTVSSYLWDNGADPIQDPQGLGVGTYNVTVTDINNCQAFTSVTIDEPDDPMGTSQFSDVTCNGLNNGSISVNISTGGGGYTYAWDQPGLSGASNTGLAPNTYSVTVTDANNCTVTFSETIAEPTAISATLTPSPTECFDQANGTAIATATGGSGSGYLFDWNCSGEVTDTPTNLPPGNCTVVVTDGSGCSESFSVNVPNAPALTVALDGTPTNLTCFENGTGAIALNASGGTGNLTYNWSDAGIANTTEDPTGLDAGSYDVTVVDANGCEEEVLNINITQPDSVDITFTTDDASCNLANGSINVTVNGGTGAPNYTWSPNIGNTGTFTNAINSGTYNLTVTDANGCEDTETIIVDEPFAMAIDNEIDGAVDCFGDSDGVVSVEISGGTGPGTYEYQWADGFPDSPTVTGLPSGVYDVDIVDGNGCILAAQVEVTEPTQVTLALDGFTNPECQNPNGTINISVSGGTVTTGYTYNWNNGAFNTEDIASLPTGNYDVVVTDNNGCSATDSYSIAAPGVFDIDPVVQSDVTCFGLDNGTITMSTSNGVGPFDYEWSDITIGNVSNPTGLAPGIYSTTITDQGTGCENIESNIIITQPVAIDLNGTVATAATCTPNTGSINAMVVGGTGTPSYSWTGPNSYTANVEDISGLEAGSYTLVITDDNSCMGSVTVVVTEPTPPTLAAIPSLVECFGDNTGSIQAIPSNPNGAVTYSWDPAIIGAGNTDIVTGLTTGNYGVTITDALNCTAEANNIFVDQPTAIDIQFGTTDAACGSANGSIDLMVSGGTVAGDYTYAWDNSLPGTQDHSAVGAGDYNVTVTDDNGCEETQLIQVAQPNAAVITPTFSNITCFSGNDGSISIGVTGGNNTNGYTFIWSGTGPIADPTLQNQTGLEAGTYSVTVFDTDNCPTSLPALVLTEASEITVADASTPALCNQNIGSITLTPSGGAGGYIYDWTDPTVADVANPTGLAPGNYEVLITDMAGCTFTDFYSVDNPDGVQFQTPSTNILCTGDATGTASLDILNANPADLTIEWLTGPTTVANGTVDAVNLLAGMYSGNITDANNCVTPFSFTITEPTDAIAATAQTNASVTCNGQDDGIAIAQAVGGTGMYSYLWDNGEMTEEITGLAPGSYEVTVTDANGCSDTPAAIVIIEPPVLDVQPTSTDLTCNGTPDGTINLTTSGGNGSYQWDWNLNQYDGLDQLSGLSAGTYEVVVTDAQNCEETLSIVITEPDAIDLQLESISEFESFNISCNSYTDGFIEVNVAGGSGSYDYLWSNGETTSSLTNIGAGMYSVTVTDENNCEINLQQELTEPTAIEVQSEEIDVRCFGDINGAIVVTNTQGGSGPYVYGLEDGPLGAGIFNGLAAGTYELVTQDANGCEMVSELEIVEPDPLEVVLDANKPILPEGHIEIEFGDSVTLTPDIFLGGAPLQLLQWDNEAILCPLGNCASINVKPLTTTTYRVTVVDENGCLHEDEIELRVVKPRNVYIPNVFNPNSDNLENNIFQVHTGRGVTSIEEFIVVDRWGEVVFRTDAPFDPNLLQTSQWGWNGTLNGKVLNPAVFVYYARVKFLDGEIIDYSGDVTLLR